jgi:hypothetical protein
MSREEANRLISLQREHNRKFGKEVETSSLGKLKSMFPVFIDLFLICMMGYFVNNICMS